MSNHTRKKPNRFIKRAIDLILCLLSIPFLLPIFLIIAILIKIDSKGKVVYTQKRIGKDGKHFRLYKFRTMVHNADELLKEYLSHNSSLEEEWQKTQKLHNDPRVTKIGHFLRKTSLDELPQILNIFLGQMTFVGPRPIVDEEIPKYGKYYKEYCELYPGLTGVWQISGRSDTTYERRLACDHFYANNWSLLLDLKIIFQTLPVAFRGFGAY